MPHRKKRRTPKQVFLATYSLRRQPRFYWVKGRLSMIRLSRLKTFRKPKRYLMSFKKLPKSTTRYKILLRLSAGKGRGFLVRKNISTGAHLRPAKAAHRHPPLTSTPSLYTTHKQKYSRAKRQPWPRRPMLNPKLSYLRFRFQSTRTPVSAILNAAPARHQISSQWNTNLKYWKMHGRCQSAQQSRTLTVYNSTEASSSFFNKRYYGLEKNSATIPLFMVNYLASLLDRSSQYTAAATNNPSVKFNSPQITSGPLVNQLSHVVNKFHTSLKKSYTIEVVPATHPHHHTKPNLRLQGLSATSPVNHLWPYFLRQWLYETAFIQRKFTLSKGATLVLSRVPSYKMDAFSPVNADRYRGNVHTKLGLTHDNLRSLSLSKGSSFLHLSHRSSFVAFLSQRIRHSRRVSPTVERGSLVDWPILSYENSESKKLESFFLPEHSILKYRPNLLLKVTKNRRLYTKLLLRTSRKIKLYNHIYATPTVKNVKKRRVRGKTRNRKSRIRIHVCIGQALKRRILRVYEALVSSRSQQLSKIKKLRWWKLPKLYKSYRRLFKVRKPRRTRARKLLNNNYDRPQNTYYAHEPSANPRQQRKGEELLTSNTSATRNTLGAHDFAPALATLVNKSGRVNLVYSNQAALTSLVWNTTLLKLYFLSHSKRNTLNDTPLIAVWGRLEQFSGPLSYKSNLVPHYSFNKGMAKKVLNSFSNKSFQTNLVPWYYNTLIRFIEDCSGKKALFQFYPFINQEMTADFVARYRRWLPRMASYERNLGHRFFLEEALHIMHLSFMLRDPKIIATWLKAMILRISFWKTRSIFRFLKYLFHNYFRHVFPDINIKGLKIRLKGKISAAGNSRKRTILYRIGKTSHSQTSLRVLSEFTTINTFTGVMGFSVWLFY